jgi:hypothetical protein
MTRGIPWEEIPKTQKKRVTYKVSIIEETISKVNNKVTQRAYPKTDEFHSLKELDRYIAKRYYTIKFLKKKQGLQRLEDGSILFFVNDCEERIDILRAQIKKTVTQEVELSLEGLPIFNGVEL